MTIDIRVDHEIGRLIVTSDDPSVRYFLERKESKYAYNPYTKTWGYQEKLVKIYDPGKHSFGEYFVYKLGLGWAGYLLSIFKDKISAENYKEVLREAVLSESYRTHPFPELRDYQNEDILFLLRYKRGLFQVQTGYGKSQSIAVLTNYAHEVLNKKVLLVCPSNKARDELVKRCKSLYGLEVSARPEDMNGHLDCIITSGLTNSKRTKDPEECHNFKKILSEYDWVLVDEVEYTINSAGEFLYDSCTGAECFYGFSGTADKEAAQAITFVNGLSESVLRNRGLVKYFGPSLIYRMPVNKVINNIHVAAGSLDNFRIDREKMKAAGNVYGEVMNQLWTDPEVVKSIMRVIKAYPLCFIPLNNLNYIINDWIDNYFKGVFNTLLICFEGYIYIDKAGNRTRLTLSECCDYIRDGKVDVIPSTSSGFRALDLPGLKNILVVTGKIAGVHLQSIGRVARGDEMNVISLEPRSGKKTIPVYTKSSQEREDLMKSFYKYCTIKDIRIDEDVL